MNNIIKKGQVWVQQDCALRICVIAVSKDTKKIFVSGLVDEVEPILDKTYFLNRYHLDTDFSL